MLSKLVLSTYLLVSSASALAHPNNIVARQTASPTASQTAACSLGPDYSSLLDSKPTVPGELAAAAASFAATATNLCDSPSFTGTISAEWSSYTSAEFAWLSSNAAGLSSVISSLESACPGASSMADVFSGLGALCTSTSAAVATTTPTASTSTLAASSKNGAAAPMQTVMAAGMAVAAGAMGILAL